MTICTKCKYFENLEPGSVREHVWYNHVCKASPLPTAIDPYDGKRKSCGSNDLGGGYFTKRAYQFCRDVNNGACPKFEQRQSFFKTIFGAKPDRISDLPPDINPN